MAAKAISAGAYQHWNTPAEVLAPLRAFLPITLDPCSNPGSAVGADVAVQLPDDGLAVDWHYYGHTFINPPYEDQAPWLLKAASECLLFQAHTITLLIPASVETASFRDLAFGCADAIAFWHRRVAFDRHDGGKRGGNSHPSALVYFGPKPERFAEHFGALATVITDWTGRKPL